MKIIKNNVIITPQKSNINICHWCKSEIEIEDADIKKGDVFYSEREIDHNVNGFDCPCCKQFTPLTNPPK